MSAAAEQVLAPHLERCFWFDAIEDSYEIHDVTGSIPRWLRGTYYVNGPACFERAGNAIPALARWRRNGVRAAFSPATACVLPIAS